MPLTLAFPHFIRGVQRETVRYVEGVERLSMLVKKVDRGAQQVVQQPMVFELTHVDAAESSTVTAPIQVFVHHGDPSNEELPHHGILQLVVERAESIRGGVPRLARLQPGLLVLKGFQPEKLPHLKTPTRSNFRTLVRRAGVERAR